MPIAPELSLRIEERLLGRGPLLQRFFAAEARRLADACRQLSERLLQGGRLLALGRGPYATDAQHVAVEFVHPVIVGKRALPALDLSALPGPWLEAIVRPEDIVMGFGPPEGDPEVQLALRAAAVRGAMTLALPGAEGTYAMQPATPDPFAHQELLELLYHTLWETVHVFFEHRERGHDVGPAAFLYPFLGQTGRPAADPTEDVARSILQKAGDGAALRARVAREMADEIGSTATALHGRLSRGGTLVLLGNGGSATDANDFAMDCVAPPPGFRPLPALSLALDAATITAIANDVGSDLIFLRQVIAQARADDAVVAISTSGSSRNVVAALAEARRRGLLTVALLGYDGGEIRQRGLADHCIVVGSDYIPRIQEVHASIYHIIRECLEALAGDGA
jgi:D-sedoheptulose 7-phosphate isomerase